MLDTAAVLAEAVRLDVAPIRELSGRRRPSFQAVLDSSLEEPLDEDQLGVPDAPLMALREARWRGGRLVRTPTPSWSKPVREAGDYALREARSQGLTRVNGTHLVLGLLADRDSAASQVLGRTGLHRRDLLHRLRKSPVARRSGQPWTPLVDTLQAFGALPAPDLSTRAVAAAGRLMVWLGGHRHPFLPVFRQELSRQAVRLGQEMISTVHLVLAVGYLGTLGVSLPDPSANTAPAVLARHGWQEDEAVRQAVLVSTEEVEPAPVAEVRGIWPALHPGDPVWGRHVVDLLRDARGAGTTLVLAAALARPGSGARGLLGALGIDADAVRFDLEYDLAASGT
jgi:hypothetical protein